MFDWTAHLHDDLNDDTDYTLAPLLLICDAREPRWRCGDELDLNLFCLHSWPRADLFLTSSPSRWRFLLVGSQAARQFILIADQEPTTKCGLSFSLPALLGGVGLKWYDNDPCSTPAEFTSITI